MTIKVCGMRNRANIQEVAALKPDFMGFIFYPKSKRYVGDDFPPSLVQSVMPEIQTVGVFVNEEIDVVLGLAKKYQLSVVQLHGNESPLSCQEIRKKGVVVWKAFGIQESLDWEILEPYLGSCDCFLFDTSTKDYGGSGKKFDWAILAGYPFRHPFLLSGGIGPDDHKTIKAMQHPYFRGIDINSCFEIEPGLKDVLKIKHFIHEIHS